MGGTPEGWIDLTDKVAAVTGAAGGIGKAAAAALAGAGASVILLDRDLAGAQAAAEQIGGTARALDVTSEDEWASLGDWIEAQFGRLDIMINCAGIALKDSVGDESLDNYRTIFDINVEGVLSGMALALKFMRKTGRGAIVNISSTGSLKGNTLMASYAASKAAVAHYSRSAALEGVRDGNDIRVNAIHPGLIETPMASVVYDIYSHVGPPDVTRDQFTTDRVGRVEEVADLILFLSSDRASYISGTSVVIDRAANA
ncbi:MAG: SDR family oxidoreductase [Novosphingobium sp.]|nr:SDR family oxidoreductase [Novosphingobium sp.]